jgi:hypothetical protein
VTKKGSRETFLDIRCGACDKLYEKCEMYVFEYNQRCNRFYIQREPYTRRYVNRKNAEKNRATTLSDYYARLYTKQTGNVLLEC